MYNPIVHVLPVPKKNIFDNELTYRESKLIDYPRSSLGFHHYLHQSKDKMEIVSEFEGKKKVYYVINEFERYVEEYKEDIGYVSEKYFGMKILSRAYYKLWEMLIDHDIIISKSGFKSAHLAEAPGSFVQATLNFRNKFDSKKDTYYVISIHKEKGGEYVPTLNNSFIKSDDRIKVFKTTTKKQMKRLKKKTNGDLTSIKTVKLFGGSVEKVDFVTADGGFNWKHENTQEQEIHKLIIGEILTMITILKENGNFVLKMYETFTDVSLKIIYMLHHYFKKIIITKPLMSRASNSERYLICKGFKDIGNDAFEVLLNVENNIVKLYDEFVLPKDYVDKIIKINIEISNKQFMLINKMVDFIKKKNYYGDVYKIHREKQIAATKYWIDTYMN